jgi:DNA-binding transcriptional LysR family regulator
VPQTSRAIARIPLAFPALPRETIPPDRTMKLTSLNALLAFVTVAEKRGFSAAARALGVSPSALSQSVRGLEDRVGVPLLLRTTRGVSLTETGRRLFERSGGGLREALDAIDEAASSGGEVQGTLRLSVPGVLLHVVVEPLLLLLMTRHPGLKVEVVVDERFADIIAEGSDAGFRLSEAIERDMIAIRVCPPFRFVIVGSPDYFARRPPPKKPEDLRQHACIAYRGRTSGQTHAWEFEQGRREFELAPEGRLVCNDARVLVSSALSGLGLIYINEHPVAEHIAQGRLQPVLGRFMPSAPGFFLHFPARAEHIPKMRALIEAARAVARARPAAGPAARAPRKTRA